MRTLILAGLVAVASTAAWAGDAPAAPQQSICVDANFGYNARSLNQHDVFIQNSVGKRPPVRLKTSCINLEPATAIAIHSAFGCVGLGDSVSASILGGRREQCVVTRVLPYMPEEGDEK
jgi:hypothetical protein